MSSRQRPFHRRAGATGSQRTWTGPRFEKRPLARGQRACDAQTPSRLGKETMTFI